MATLAPLEPVAKVSFSQLADLGLQNINIVPVTPGTWAYSFNWFVGLVGAGVAIMSILAVIPGLPATALVVIFLGSAWFVANGILGLPAFYIETLTENWYRLFLWYFSAIAIKIARKDGTWWANLF